MQNVTLPAGFTILSFLPRPSGSDAQSPSFQPHSIRRDRDQEVFTIGDTITNENGMRGQLTGFEMLEDSIFVKHTWSGVGYTLDMAIKVQLLPSEHQVHDQVFLLINQEDTILKGRGFGNMIESKIKARILAVHFHNKKEKYDLEIELTTKGKKTRIYNVDPEILQAVTKY